MRRLVPALCSLCLVAGEAAPDPSVYLPAEPAVTVQAPDLLRSRKRWESSPYAALTRTLWGQISAERLEQLLNRYGPDLPAACAGALSLAGGLAGGPDGHLDAMLAVRGDGAAMQRADQILLPRVSAVGSRQGEVFVLAAGSTAVTQARSPALAVADGQADLLLSCVPSRLARLFIAPGPSGLDQQPALTASLRLDVLGMRERWNIPYAPQLAPVWQKLRPHHVDTASFATLPRTALCAIAAWNDSGATRALCDQLRLEGSQDLEAQLKLLGLPGCVETLSACNGPCLAWLEEGIPFPSITVGLGMEAKLAQRWVEGAGTRFNLVANADGSRSGFAGIVPLAIACEIAQDGSASLVLTTSQQGLDSWRKRPGGFAEHAEIKAALKELPADIVIAGVSRSGASWASVAQLAVLPLSQFAPPQIMSLPQDLRQIGKHGFLWLKLDADAAHAEAGGLFGGPLGWGLAGACITGGLMAHQQAVVEDRRALRVEPAPEVAPASPTVF